MLMKVKTWIVVVLRFLDMIFKMNLSIESELQIPDFGFIPYSNLHAFFDELNDIFGQNFNKKSCASMSLGPTMKISASL